LRLLWTSMFRVCHPRGVSLFVFFFFQAEDGIRDLIVTGVQTCALPIWFKSGHPDQSDRVAVILPSRSQRLLQQRRSSCAFVIRRSEERRVGKECRFRWAG